MNLLKEDASVELIAKVTPLDKKTIKELKTTSKSNRIDK